MSISEIARVLGISRNTVRAALASDGPPKYVRKPAGSAVDVVEPRIRELLRAYPRMPATVIAERIGWTRSIRTLSSRVAELRPAYLPPDPASRTSYVAGEIAQCDLWFPPIMLPVGFGQARKPVQLPVLTMIAGYSRWLSAVLIPSRRAEDLFAGWWQLIEGLQACPRVLVWDGEGAIGRWRAGKPELTAGCQQLLRAAGFKVDTEFRSCGADDFSYFSAVMPTVMMFAGSGTAESLHHPRFLPSDDSVGQVARAMLAGYLAGASSLAEG